MDTANSNSLDRQRLLDEVVAAYLEAVEAGGDAPNQQEWVGRYPELAPDLQEFFDARRQVRNWAAPEPSATQTWLPPTTEYRGERGAGAAVDRSSLQPATAGREPVEIGALFANRYRVFDIKAGGMGCVYLADDMEALGRGWKAKRAIKTVEDFDVWRKRRKEEKRPADPSSYRGLLARFRREAITWVRLGPHENIIWAMYVTEVGNKPHLIMEYAESGDLATWIKQDRLSVPLAVDFALQFCEGMKHAVRTSGIVHRDIKPSNVLIKDNQILKIADFGLSKAFDDSADDIVRPDGGGAHMHSSAPFGTGPYMPPEQFEGIDRADTRSDIFSFGVMLHEMLTGQRLFPKPFAYEMSCKNAPLPAAHEANPAVPRDLSAVVLRCLRYDPLQRFQSFDDLADTLAGVKRALDVGQPGACVPKTIPAELLNPSLKALSESYSLISLGNFAEAARRAQQGIDVDPLNFEHWVNRSKALIELREYDRARECCQRAVELKPRDARSWANLGWVELLQGRPAAGLAAAERATGFDAEFGDAWMCSGRCQEELGNPRKALQSHRIAVHLEPHNWKAHHSLALCLLRQGQHAEARVSLDLGVQINPEDADTWRQIGWLDARRGAWREARAAIDRSLKIDPADAAAWALRAWIVWAGEADAQVAKTSLAKSFELDPNIHQGKIVLGVLTRAGIAFP